MSISMDLRFVSIDLLPSNDTVTYFLLHGILFSVVFVVLTIYSFLATCSKNTERPWRE